MDYTNDLSTTSGMLDSNLVIDSVIKSDLRKTAKWTKFLSILGFIFVAIMVVFSLIAGTVVQSMMRNMPIGGGEAFPIPGGGIFLTLFYLLFALLYFFPCLYLFKYSSALSKALNNDDQMALHAATKNERKLYTFVGILMIVILSFYALIFLTAIVAGAVMGA